MEYWARINGKDYPLDFGFTITEEFSESLDSASISISHIKEIIDMKPYDDVIIHDYAPDSSGNPTLPDREIGVVFTPEEGHFYHHFILRSFTREQVNLSDKFSATSEEGTYDSYIFNYNLELQSETAGLETVQLPNRTISQPMSVADYSSDSDSDWSEPIFLPSSNGRMTIPYYPASSWRDALVIGKLEEMSTLVDVYSILISTTLSDQNSNQFTKVVSKVNPGDEFVLPDWLVKEVKVIHSFGKKEETFSPKKHFMIRKVGENDSYWGTREDCIERIKSYLDGTECSEIKNSEFGIPRGYNPDSSSKKLYPVCPSDESGQFEIYLYVEPRIYDCESIEKTINVFGMTDNTSGAVPPSEDDEFLAKWVFSTPESAQVSAGVISVYEAVRQAVEIYSPYIKVTSDGETWSYVRKYSISDDFRSKFLNVVAPENQWNFPNLRDFITRLTYVKDCIPTVHDGVISFMDLSARNSNPFSIGANEISFEQYSMDGGSYCDRVLRTYRDGLSKDNITQCVERIPFKCQSSSVLTLENLTLELSHPIYKINKILMCYYNNSKDADGNAVMRLIKQDITPLVLLDDQRNLLNEDWVTGETSAVDTISEFAKHRYATVGYSIGSNKISGWGEKYSYPNNVFFKATRSVIENIFEFMESNYPYGSEESDIYSYGSEHGYISQNDEEFVSNATESRNFITSNAEKLSYILGDSILGFSSFIQRLKSIVFIVEYEGYVTSAVLASKDFHDGNIVSRDNASSSLSFVESDGINQKEKVNRLGNAATMVSARHSSIGSIQPLASVYTDEVGDGQARIHDDEVLFRRSVTYTKDYFDAAYYLCRNYVIRNYFTSVFAKRRPFPLASESESTDRIENKSIEILLSPDEFYWQDESKQIDLGTDVFDILSFYNPTSYLENGEIAKDDSVNCAYYTIEPSDVYLRAGQYGIFEVDCQKFVSGYSACVVVGMKDSVSAGVYAKNYNPTFGSYLSDVVDATLKTITGNYWDLSYETLRATNAITGGKQEWFMFPTDEKNGFMYFMDFGAGRKSGNDAYAVSSFAPYIKFDIASSQLLPLSDSVLHKVDGSYIYYGSVPTGGSGLVGLGYPSIYLQKDSDEDYYVVNTDSKYHYFPKDELVYESSSYPSIGFYNVDGEKLSDRPTIDEYISARFVGSEREGWEERDDCVFKDGRERMSVTMQIEPVSEDKRVLFSGEMMKLSDFIGGTEKNFIDVGTVIHALAYPYTSKRYYITTVITGTYAFSVEVKASVPLVAIYLPKGTTASQIAGANLVFSYSWKKDSIEYSFTSGKGVGLDSEGNLQVGCYITIKPDEEIPALQTVLFHKVGDDTSSFIFSGRTRKSSFILHSFGNVSKKDGYDLFVMAEDGFFTYGDEEAVFTDISMSKSSCSLENSAIYPAEGSLVGSNEFVCKDEGYCNMVSSYYSDQYGTVTESIKYNNRKFSFNVSKLGFSSQVSVHSYNMFWGLFPKMSSYDVRHSSYSSVSPSEITDRVLSEFSPSQGEDNGKKFLRFSLPVEINGPCSLRLYHRGEDTYDFVFGINLAPYGYDSDSDLIQPTVLGDGSKEYRVYISVLDSRSKTVWDAKTGDPTYRIFNFCGSDLAPSNKCVEK